MLPNDASAVPTAAESRRWFPVWVAVMTLAVGRLGWLQWEISRTAYQGDFTAYWNAGRAVLAGADPYSYGARSAGGDPFYFTGFLYPPLVASFFAPLARLDFYHAKLVWSALQLVFLIGAVGLAAGLIWPGRRLAGTALLLAAASVFPPVQLEFERGQIDCLTLALIAGAAWAWVARGRAAWGAVLLVAAGVFKLPTLLLLAVPVAVRDRAFVRAAAASVAAVAVLSLALNGPGLTRRYWLRELPALAGLTHGGASIRSNPPPMPPPVPGVLPASQGGPAVWPRVVWEGHPYWEKSTFPVRGAFVSAYVSPVPVRLRQAASVAGFGLALAALALGGRAAAAGRRPDRRQVLLAFAMVTVLVCYPLSWLMNYVWLLYAGPVLLLAARRRGVPRVVFFSALAGTALCFTGAVPAATGLLYKALDQRFCLGSLLLYASGLALLWHRGAADPVPGVTRAGETA